MARIQKSPTIYSQRNRTVDITNQILFILTLFAGSLYQLSSLAKGFSLGMCLILSIYGVLILRPSGRSLLVFAYCTLVFCLAILSAMKYMPDAWTTIRSNELLLRQASIHFLFPLTALGYAAILSVVGKHIVKISLLCVIPISVIAIFVYSRTNQVGTSTEIFLINNLYSMEVYRIFFLGVLILTLKNRILFGFALLVILYFSFSFQAVLTAMIILSARLFTVKTWMIFTGLAVMIIATFASTYNWQYLMNIDHNIGVRALFWNNALLALYQTGLLGVGYGTESIIPFYPHNGVMRYFGPSIPSEYSVIGVHSSFFQQLFNAGVLGLFLLSSWIAICIKRLGGKDGIIPPLDYLAAGMFFLSVFANMALDSYNFMQGSAFLFGWIIHRGNVRSRSLRSVDN